MNIKKQIGIISSILLIIYYTINLIWIIFPFDIYEPNIFFEYYFSINLILLALCQFGLYYALSKYLNPTVYKTEVKILTALMIIPVITIILNYIPFVYQLQNINFNSVLNSIIGLFQAILFIIFGILVLKNKDKSLPNYKFLKSFIISLFIIMPLTGIIPSILIVLNLVDLASMPYSLYIIGYLFVLIFFLEDKSEDYTLVNEQN